MRKGGIDTRWKHISSDIVWMQSCSYRMQQQEKVY
nr:MAG TPA: hypothetical protein [Caudoviricetes sp.]